MGIVKLRFIGEYIIFLFLLRIIDCEYSLEPPRIPTFNVLSKLIKYNLFSSGNYHFTALNIAVYCIDVFS